MLQEAPDDRLDPDVFRQSRHPRPQAADAAHHQFDLHPRTGGAIERIDDLGMDECVQLAPDRPIAPGPDMADLVVDQLQDGGFRVERRNGDLFQDRRLGVAGDEIEQPPGVAPQGGIAGEEREILIDARGDRVVIAGAEMGVGAQALALAPHH